MSRNVNPKLSQLLNQTPNFRTARADLVRDFRSANDNRGVGNEKTHSAPQSRVRLSRERVLHGHSGT